MDLDGLNLKIKKNGRKILNLKIYMVKNMQIKYLNLRLQQGYYQQKIKMFIQDDVLK